MDCWNIDGPVESGSHEFTGATFCGDIPKQSSAAQVYKELTNWGMILVEVFPGGWGAWSMETMEQESWGSSRDWLKGWVMESQLVGENRELGADSCSDFLIESVTSGKLPHISGLQFLPTCK